MNIVIMAGGSGTRFWPKSVSAKPKQFLALTSERSLLQDTYWRFRQWLPAENIYVVTSGKYLEMVCEQLAEVDRGRIIIEPAQRDTGPCIALTAHYFLSRGIDDVMACVPSDHYIPDASALRREFLRAESQAGKRKSIVTFGIAPTRPETGFGYIETCPDEANSDPPLRVRRFWEKPALAEAEKLARQAHVYWNSGIFVWRPSTIRYYMELHQPQIWRKVVADAASLPEAYKSIEPISVDYAVIEKATDVYCIPVNMVWEDIGFWTSLERIFAVDDKGNLLRGDVHTLATERSIILAEQGKVIVVGLNDCIVVQTEHGLLVCHKEKEQMVKQLFRQSADFA
ncbi:MAG TPA: sugar phosphate nucleotidyltransferase [Bacilli bacterium]